MFLGYKQSKTYHVLAFPVGEGADQRMRREADEGYATPPLTSDSRPLNPNLKYFAIGYMWHQPEGPPAKESGG